MNTSSHIAEKIALFKADLLSKDTGTIVHRYVLHGNPAIMSETMYFDLKNLVSTHLKVPITEIFMVGSGKLGFSIKESRRFMPFGDSSDIDLAIVSPELFQAVWHEVYNYKNESGWWPKHNEFKKYLFRGWIRPDYLPPSEAFSFSREWREFFRKVTESGVFGPYKITAGIYASAFFFEGYQSICVDQCKREEV